VSASYTTNLKLGEPAVSDTGWGPVITGDFTTLDALAPVGHLAVTTHEVPSASLFVDIAAGFYVKQDGTTAQYAGTTSYPIAGSSTLVLYLDGTASYALIAAASYPTTAHVRLATVVTGSSTITSITDNRKCFMVLGTWADGTNITLGASAGTQIGTSASQKLGFLGATPALQQTGGAATAGASYTSNEQSMLQKAFNALRTFGLLS
jgi:hypothetical protein